VEPESEHLDDRPVRLSRESERDERETEPTGPHPRKGHRRLRGWWVVTVLALVAGLVVVSADARERSREVRAVTACETQLRWASGRADYRMGLTTNYVRSIPSARGLQTHLADLMAPRARLVLPAVQRADRACKALAVRPWHFSLVARQHAATAYSSALVTLLQIVAAQGRGKFHDNRTLLRLRNAAGLSGG
jgi:hypothetical protein